MNRILVLLVLVSMASVCLADSIQELEVQAFSAWICKPPGDFLDEYKIQAIDACVVPAGLKVDPYSIQTCNVKEYGPISLNEKRKKVCAMTPEDRGLSVKNVSTNWIDLSLEFYLYFYLLLLFLFR